MKNRVIRITQIIKYSRKKLRRKETEKKGACEKGKERRESLKEKIVRERERVHSEGERKRR